MTAAAATIIEECQGVKVCDLSTRHALYSIDGEPFVVIRGELVIVGRATRLCENVTARALARLWRPTLSAWVEQHRSANHPLQPTAERTLEAWARA